MISSDLTIITSISFALLFWGIYILKKWNDEIPAVISLLNLCFLWRFFAIKIGIAEWVNFDYGIPFEFSDIWAVKALYYILLGMCLLVFSYHMFRRYRTPIVGNDVYPFKDYLFRNRSLIVISLFISFLLSIVAGLGAYSHSGSSYILYLPLLTTSTVTLGFLLLKQKILDGFTKLIILSLLSLNILSTLVASNRFALLSWVIIGIILFFDQLKFSDKILGFSIFGILFLIIFNVLGMRRYLYFVELNFLEQVRVSVFNLAQFNDFNMLDGMVMLLQVIPKHLDYSFGTGHLEILARPIPRAFWTEKPVGAWQQKLAIVQAKELYGDQASASFFGTGISPTLFGDFYSEAGLIGVILLCVLYGYLIARIINLSEQHTSDLRPLIRGMLIAFLFPLLRGGDLPGIVAIMMMAYWPLIYFSWAYRRLLCKRFSMRRMKYRNIP